MSLLICKMLEMIVECKFSTFNQYIKKIEILELKKVE